MGPTPKTSVSVVPEARTATVSLFLTSRICAPMRRRSAGELGGELAAGRLHRPGRRDALQELPGLSCADPLPDTTGDQLAPRGVEPAGHLGPGAAQIPVPLGPHPQHRRVIISGHLPAG